MHASDGAPRTASFNPEYLLQLHLYEYQALTNRCTYLITMQYALWPTLFISLSLLAPLWDSHSHSFLLWAGLFFAQLVSLGWYFTGCEIYITVDYLERGLKPQLEQMTSGERFWGWEPWLARIRGSGVQWWECWVTCFVSVLFCLLVLLLPPWVHGYWLGFLLNSAALALIVLLNVKLTRIRQRFS